MTDKKLTDKDIIKALECCSIEINCRNCPIHMENSAKCVCTLLRNAHDIITRQQSKIDDLMERTAVTTLIDDAVVYTPTLEDYNKFKEKFKSEAVKEFANKVVCDIDTYCEKYIETKPFFSGVTAMKIAHNLIYKRLREMVGENNGNG